MTVRFPKSVKRSTKCCQKSRRCGRGRALRVETMEPRQMLDATGFLQGIAFIDADGDNLLDAGEARKFNTTIQLQATDGSVLDDTTTDANGYYRFDGLVPGTYRLHEVAPSGYINQGVQIMSQVNPASIVDTSTIEVTVLDPNDLAAHVEVTDDLIINFMEDVNFTLNGNPEGTAVGPFPVSVTGGGLMTPAEFVTYCLNYFENFGYGDNDFQVTPDFTLPSPQDAVFGRIAYIFNHYGTSAYGQQVDTTVEGAGLQLAIFELLYDGGDDANPFTTGNFLNVTPYVGGLNETSPAEVAAALAFAEDLLDESVGQFEAAMVLDAWTQATPPPPGRQTVIATGSYNFANSTSASLEGKKFKEVIVCKCDKYGNPIESIETSPMGGVTINLYRDLNGNGQLDPNEHDQLSDLVATTITAAVTGKYSFTNLTPGDYIIQEVVGAGYAPVGSDAIAVTLAPGEHDAVGNNFTNRLVKASVGNYFFIDTDQNGIQNLGDFGVNGVTVNLLNSYGDVIATTVTANDGAGNDGFYLFYNLDAGNYRVEFEVPDGVQFTAKGAGTDTGLDSDANSNGRTDTFSLGANMHRRDIDAGVKPEVCIDSVVYKVKDYFDKCQESKAGVIKGVTLEYNEALDELYVQVTVTAYNGRVADGFTIVIGEGESLGSVTPDQYAVFYFDATRTTPVLNVLGYNGKSDGTSIKDSNGYTSSYDPDRIATSKDNSSGWVKELSVVKTGTTKSVMTFRIDVGAINDHVPLRNLVWQGAEIGRYASFVVDTFDGLTTEYNSAGYLTKWSYCYHGWADACKITTQKCIIENCTIIDDFFAEWGWTKSAYTGNSDGDPLEDIFWDGSEAVCKCDSKCDYDNDCGVKDNCFNDWDKNWCYGSFGGYSRC